MSYYLVHEKGFPRIRGDVPSIESKKDFRGTFSPHTRGCSWCAPPAVDDSIVFPAYAGMFRSPWGFRQGSIRFPRIRGDVPCTSRTRRVGTWFSPHTRGCSVYEQDETGWHLVFPAYAGMFRPAHTWCPATPSFPRIRGDVPREAPAPKSKPQFSPHTRGCSHQAAESRSPGQVFPAYAGMFRRASPLHQACPCFPRIRGDVPGDAQALTILPRFSPHTRGCSHQGRPACDLRCVFPAHAGMFRR